MRWEKVRKTSTCWLWIGCLDKDGYARSGGRNMHRLAYEEAVGPIPDGLTIDHLCRVRNCVNPAHMEPVPIRENIMRGDTQAARKAAQIVCVNGHPFNKANTGVKYPPSHPNGMRYCKKCSAAQHRAYRAAQKARQEDL